MQNQSPDREDDKIVCSYFRHIPSRPILSSASHKILLGVLKKIETKNAVTLAVIIFLLGGLLSIFSAVKETDGFLVLFYLFIVGFLAGPLLAGIDGAGHLGQPKYVRLANRCCECCRAKDLQKQLLKDLVAKEYAFQITRWIIAAAILAELALLLWLSFSAT
jgi:hypothetical protein